jgi:putative transposase
VEVTRTEQFRIGKNSEYWKIIDDLAWKSKNVYNSGNYIIRQEFFKTSKEKEAGLRDHANWIRYKELDKMLQGVDCYKELTSQSSQATLKALDKNWKSFFASVKDYSKHPEKYTGSPKLPRYKNTKTGREQVRIKNNQCRMKDGYIYFSWTPLKPLNNHFKSIYPNDRIFAARFKIRNHDYILEVIHELEIPEIEAKGNRIAAIDIGVDNLATVVSNCGIPPFAINGKPLKSINHYYNKNLASLKSDLKIKTGKNHSNRINSLTAKRNRKVDDYMHKASKIIVDWCMQNQIDTLVLGHNEGWKQECKLGNEHNKKDTKRANQNFVCIPFNSLIEKLAYKCENVGITFIEREEAYTSGTSFLDSEPPTKKFFDKSRRIHRGMFVANDGTEINADVNAAYQILRKAFPDKEIVCDRETGLHPVIITPDSPNDEAKTASKVAA